MFLDFQESARIGQFYFEQMFIVPITQSEVTVLNWRSVQIFSTWDGFSEGKLLLKMQISLVYEYPCQKNVQSVII